MHFLLRATVLGAVSALSHAESNPTHYGLPSELGGQCQDDERDSAWDSIVLKLVRHMPTFYTCNAVHPKSSDDCPTDTPEGATESVSSAFFSPQDPDVWICGKTCLRDADCGGMWRRCKLHPFSTRFHPSQHLWLLQADREVPVDQIDFWSMEGNCDWCWQWKLSDRDL